MCALSGGIAAPFSRAWRLVALKAPVTVRSYGTTQDEHF